MDKAILKVHAELGDASAMLAYGIACSIERQGDLDEAISWCKLAGDCGLPFGTFVAATLMQERSASPQGEVLALLRKAAQDGSASAMYHLALTLETLPNERAEAVYWYREAALRSHARSACRMADLVENGAITDEEGAPHSAVGWYELAGRLGDSHAAFRLGEVYSEGASMPKDAQLSRHWFEVSSILGNSMAHRLLALEFGLGRSGFPFDPALAEFHEKRAEECFRRESIEKKIRHGIIERMEHGDSV